MKKESKLSEERVLHALTSLNPSAADKAKIDELAQRLNQAEEGAERRRVLEDILHQCDAQIGLAVIDEASRQRLRARETSPALTLLDWDGEWAVTLNDYGGPSGDEVSSVRVFASKEEAEALLAECRAHKGQDAPIVLL